MKLLTTDLIDSNPYRPDYDLYPVAQSLSYMSNINSLRLMYILQAVLKEKNSMSTKKVEIPVTPLLLSYLELSKEDNPLQKIEYALSLIANSPIFIIRRDNHDIPTWSSISWFTKYVVDGKSKTIHLRTNPEALSYFLKLDALFCTRPQSCLRLSRTYPLWLYITLTNASLHGDYWIIPTEEFSYLSMMEDKKTYNERERIPYIPKNLLGVSPSEAMIEEEKLARKENRPIHFIPSIFSSRGGNLLVIRAKSELLVNFCNIKVKNTLVAFAFSFRKEDNNDVFFPETLEYLKSATFEEELQQSNILSTIK